MCIILLGHRDIHSLIPCLWLLSTLKKKTKTMASSPITSWQIGGEKVELVTDFIFFGSKIIADCDYSHGNKRCLLLRRKAITKLDSILKSCHCQQMYSESYSFSSSHVWMWELDHREGWAPKDWCFWILLEKTFESPLDIKEIKPVNPKGNKTSLEGLLLKLKLQWLKPPDVKSRLIGKDPDAGKD